MAIDFAGTLEKQSSLVRQMSRNVLLALARGTLTLDQVLEIDASVHRCSANFERIAQALDGHGLDEGQRRKADAIRAIWSNLCGITHDRLHMAQAANESAAHAIPLDRKA